MATAKTPIWSYSKLNTYENCPRKFYYDYVLHLEKKWLKDPGNAGVLGSYMGNSMYMSAKEARKKYYSGGIPMITEESCCWEQVIAEYASRMKEHIPEGGSFEVEVLKEWGQGHNKRKFVGYIDWMHPNKESIIDFKLSSGTDRFAKSLQLPLYEYASGITSGYYLIMKSNPPNWKLKTWDERADDLISKIEDPTIISPEIDPIDAWGIFTDSADNAEDMIYLAETPDEGLTLFPKCKENGKWLCNYCDHTEICKKQ
ncbi:MAG: PD-(D/E)XK nuclease family protein [Prevotella sp.]